MKVLFAAPENAWGGILNRLRQAHPELEFIATGKFQITSLRGYHALIPTMSPVTAQVMETANSLRLIQQIGAGLEGVDIDAATARGIQVANIPTGASGNADSVAELGIFMMLGLARQALEIPANLRQGRLGWPMGISLKGKTAGLIGLGGIGKALIQRLKAFDMRLIGIKRQASAEFAAAYGLDWVGSLAELPQLLAESDFVILSLPDSSDTHGLIDQTRLAQVKSGGFLINLGRGGLVDRQALLNALQQGNLAGAGLDVFWQEPPDPDDPIFSCNVIATPHIGGVTDISLDGNYRGVSENLRRLQHGEPILYCQNQESLLTSC